MALAILLAGASASGQRTSSRAKRKGRRSCRIVGCSRCSSTDRGKCEACRVGWVLTEGEKCQVCPTGCKSCTTTAPDSCDACKPGHTLTEGRCMPCAAHCLQCDEAGPGGCNECGQRRMLNVRLDHDASVGEVHECLSCGNACRKCSIEAGCEACDTFYAALPHGSGCAFSWLRVLLLVAFVGLAIGGCCYALSLDEFDHRPPPRRPPPRKKDSAEVIVRPRDGADDSVRQRHGRPQSSPERERRESAYPLMPGYSGIEIVNSVDYTSPHKS